MYFDFVVLKTFFPVLCEQHNLPPPPNVLSQSIIPSPADHVPPLGGSVSGNGNRSHSTNQWSTGNNVIDNCDGVTGDNLDDDDDGATGDDIDDDGDGATGDEDNDDGDGATGDEVDDDGNSATGDDNDGDGTMGDDDEDDGDGRRWATKLMTMATV